MVHPVRASTFFCINNCLHRQMELERDKKLFKIDCVIYAGYWQGQRGIPRAGCVQGSLAEKMLGILCCPRAQKLKIS